MASNHNDVQATVEKFFSALAVGDRATCEELFTEDAVIWHNYDQLDQPKGEALQALSGLAQLRPQFDLVGRDFMDDGSCVQRHVVRLSLPDGETAAIPVIQRIYFVEGRIRRIEEYMDSAQMGAAVQALQAGA